MIDHFVTHVYNVFRTAYLDADVNQLHGAIPTALDNVENLGVLYLGDNLLTSTLPSSLFGLTRLESLNVGYNMLSGTLPSIEPGSWELLSKFCHFFGHVWGLKNW
jgi:Leucine-rich repeat (LRR) protein